MTSPKRLRKADENYVTKSPAKADADRLRLAAYLTQLSEK
jgi:hypothetical protein